MIILRHTAGRALLITVSALVFVCWASLGAQSSSSAAPNPVSTVVLVVNQSIGPLHLGQSVSAAHKALGKKAALTSTTISLDLGKGYSLTGLYYRGTIVEIISGDPIFVAKVNGVPLAVGRPASVRTAKARSILAPVCLSAVKRSTRANQPRRFLTMPMAALRPFAWAFTPG